MAIASNRSFIEFHQIPTDAMLDIIERAEVLAIAWADRRMPQSLQGKTVGLIADDGGWRNTTAFDLGVRSMGGLSINVPISFDTRESTEDLAGYLDNWFDMLIVRTKSLSTLHALAASAKTPVINARTRSNHPCETLGDLAYIRKVQGATKGLKIVAVAPDANILRSWVEASLSLPIEVTQVFPEKWHVVDPALLNANFTVSTDMKALLDADVIVTDSWPDDADHFELQAFQISACLLDDGHADRIFLPCPPVTRGMEATAEAMTHPTCQSTQAKAFLLHAQNALLEWIVS